MASSQGSFSKDKNDAVVREREVSFKPRKAWKLGGEDRSYVPIDAGYPDSLTSSSSSDIETNTHPNGASVFDDAAAAEFYKPIEKYEGRHRFDPSAQWTAAEEKKLLSKVCVVLLCLCPSTAHMATG